MSSIPDPVICRAPVWRESVRGPVEWTPHPRHSVESWLKYLECGYQPIAELLSGFRAVRVVVRALTTFMNWNTGELFPSLKQIAKRAGYCVSHTHFALALAADFGIVSWVRRCDVEKKPGSKKYTLKQESNAYTLHPPAEWVKNVWEGIKGPIKKLRVIGMRKKQDAPLPIAPLVAQSTDGAEKTAEVSAEALPKDLLAWAREKTALAMRAQYRAILPQRKKPPS